MGIGALVFSEDDLVVRKLWALLHSTAGGTEAPKPLPRGVYILPGNPSEFPPGSRFPATIDARRHGWSGNES